MDVKKNLTQKEFLNLVCSKTIIPSWVFESFDGYNLALDQVERLSRDDNWRVRESIARRDDLTAEQVDRLSRDENEHVRAQPIEQGERLPNLMHVLLGC